MNYRIYKIAAGAYSVAPDNGVARQLQDYCTMDREGVVAFMRQCQRRVHGADDSNLNEILASLETFLDDPGLGFKGIVQFDSRTEDTPRVTGSPLVMAARLPGRE